MGRRIRHFAAALTAVLGIVLAGCAGVGPPPPPTPLDREAYDAAVAAAERNPREGIQRLDTFVRQQPRSALADDAALRLADLYLAAGDEGSAAQRLEWILRKHPRGDRSDAARLRLARLQRRRGDARAAYRTASELRVDALPAEERARVSRLLAELAGESGDPAAQLGWLARMRASESDAKGVARLDDELNALIAHMDAGELERAAERLGRAVPAARVRLRQAELALARADAEEAQRALARAAALPLSGAEAERLAALEVRLSTGVGGPGLLRRLPGPSEVRAAPAPDPSRLSGTLGVVLPLSGPYAPFGEESLQGILLATGLFGSEGKAPSGLRLLVRDSGGSAEGAARAVRELAGHRDLLAILGPLLGVEAAAAATAAERAGVPLLALSRQEAVAFDRPNVFRLGLTPRLEVELLVDYAFAELGARRFAILHPKDDYGQRLRNLFWEAVELRGGEVVGLAGYEADATDFAEPIRSLVGFQLMGPQQKAALARRKRLLDRAKRSGRETAAELRAQARKVRGPGGQPLPPYIDFDALFVPDSHENVVLIAPQLAFHEVRGVRLLGPSGWNHPDLVTIARKHVNGAVFVGSVNRDSEEDALARFATRYEATFDRPVDSFAAESFDAATLLLMQLERRRDSRSAVREGLLQARQVGGVSGVVSVRPDGNADKRAHLLGVHRGSVVSLDELGGPPHLRGAPARAGN